VEIQYRPSDPQPPKEGAADTLAGGGLRSAAEYDAERQRPWQNAFTLPGDRRGSEYNELLHRAVYARSEDLIAPLRDDPFDVDTGSCSMYAIGLCFDENYLLPGLVTIMSVADSTSAGDRKSIAIRIITHDLTKPHADAIVAFSRALGFESIDVKWHSLYETHPNAELAHITATTYLRFDFSPDFVRRPYLVYLDSDLLVLDDISSPFESIDACHLGVVRDEFSPTVGECKALPGFVDQFPCYYGSQYFNAGALWLDTHLMPTVKEAVIEILRGAKRRYVYYNDQDAMNIWLLERRLLKQLPGHLNRFEIGRFLELTYWPRKVVPEIEGPRHASVLHFMGPFKPWQRHCPTTPGVSLYRHQMAEAQRLLQKLGIRTFCVLDDS
jgi:lipopolysaccharide biosynthesis glycosyltransferase